MNAPAPKLNLNENSNALQVYVFTVQNGSLNLEVPEDTKMFLAYNDITAIEMVRKEYSAGFPIAIRKRATIPVQKIIDVLNIPTNGTATVPQKIDSSVESPISKEVAERNFIYGMMMVADKFVVDKRDQATIKRIINKVLKTYDEKVS